jgi:diguanylate cyclase (GGDEF)-like protein/PAS domain S-box-containing protein
MTHELADGSGLALRRLAGILVERLGIALAGVLLPESDGFTTALSAHDEDAPEQLPYDELAPLLLGSAERRTPVFLAEAGAHGLAGRSLAVLPLSGPDAVPLGWLVAVGGEPREWTPAEVAALESSAAAAAAELQWRREAEERRSETRRRRMLEQALEMVPMGVTITDQDGRIVYTNPAEAKMHGYQVEDLYGRSARSLAPAQLHSATPPGPRVRRWIRERLNLRSDGTEFPVRLWSDALVEGDQPVGLVTACVDLTEWKESEAELRRREIEFRSIVEHASDLILRFGADQRLAYLNPAAERGLGLHAAVSEGRTLAEIAEAEGVQLPWAAALSAVYGGEEESYGEGEMLAPGRSVWLRFRVLREPGADPATASALVFASDITEHRQRESRLIQDAERDALTGLLNRDAFLWQLELASGRREQGEPYAVLFLDLDRFKPVNDQLGHAAGDAVLVAVADRLRSGVRPSDTVGRLGGDEFAVLLNGAERESDAVSVVERLQRLLAVPVDAVGHELRVSVSIGIALAGKEDSADAVLRNADRAMYRAKSIGPGHYGVLDTELAVHEEAVLDAKKDLRLAIERDQLVLYYQPIVSLNLGRLVALEALVRWEHPERGLLGPQAFLPIAEETGLIVDVDRWVLRAAAHQARQWLSTGIAVQDTPISVNFSGRHIGRPDAADFVEHVLTTESLEAACLMIEVTETSVMDDREAAAASLTRLRRMGIRICLDDFGTGYSSLAYLRQFPFDVLKIDRSFVQRIDASQADRAIVRSILALARTLGLEVTAEGVETARQRAVLRRLGCHQAQGFLVAEPAPAHVAEGWLRTSLPSAGLAG